MYARAAGNGRPPPDAVVWRVPLEVGDGQYAEVLSSRVFSFKSGASRCCSPTSCYAAATDE